jgi:hypothetical protein
MRAAGRLAVDRLVYPGNARPRPTGALARSRPIDRHIVHVISSTAAIDFGHGQRLPQHLSTSNSKYQPPTTRSEGARTGSAVARFWILGQRYIVLVLDALNCAQSSFPDALRSCRNGE